MREYRVLEAEERFPDPVTWERICELYAWPQTFAGSATGHEHDEAPVTMFWTRPDDDSTSSD